MSGGPLTQFSTHSPLGGATSNSLAQKLNTVSPLLGRLATSSIIFHSCVDHQRPPPLFHQQQHRGGVWGCPATQVEPLSPLCITMAMVYITFCIIYGSGWGSITHILFIFIFIFIQFNIFLNFYFLFCFYIYYIFILYKLFNLYFTKNLFIYII